MEAYFVPFNSLWYMEAFAWISLTVTCGKPHRIPITCVFYKVIILHSAQNHKPWGNLICGKNRTKDFVQNMKKNLSVPLTSPLSRNRKGFTFAVSNYSLLIRSSPRKLFPINSRTSPHGLECTAPCAPLLSVIQSVLF